MCNNTNKYGNLCDIYENTLYMRVYMKNLKNSCVCVHFDLLPPFSILAFDKFILIKIRWFLRSFLRSCGVSLTDPWIGLSFNKGVPPLIFVVVAGLNIPAFPPFHST